MLSNLFPKTLFVKCRPTFGNSKAFLGKSFFFLEIFGNGKSHIQLPGNARPEFVCSLVTAYGRYYGGQRIVRHTAGPRVWWRVGVGSVV